MLLITRYENIDLFRGKRGSKLASGGTFRDLTIGEPALEAVDAPGRRAAWPFDYTDGQRKWLLELIAASPAAVRNITFVVTDWPDDWAEIAG